MTGSNHHLAYYRIPNIDGISPLLVLNRNVFLITYVRLYVTHWTSFFISPKGHAQQAHTLRLRTDRENITAHTEIQTSKL